MIAAAVVALILLAVAVYVVAAVLHDVRQSRRTVALIAEYRGGVPETQQSRPARRVRASRAVVAGRAGAGRRCHNGGLPMARSSVLT